MPKISDEHLRITKEVSTKAIALSNELIKYMESTNADIRVAVLAAGIAYSKGSMVLGAPLPATIDVIRMFYKNAEAAEKAKNL